MDDLAEKYSPVLRKYWFPLALGLVGLIFLVYGMIGFLGKGTDDEDILFDMPEQSATASAKQRTLMVDVEGAVFKPGVYELAEGSRIQDALIAAGGMSGEADRELVSKRLNLASKVVDGGKIYIPFVGEDGQVPGQQEAQGVEGDSGQAGVTGGSGMTGRLVDINSASESELESLPGVGPVTAGKIIDGRRYQTIDELVSKRVVGASLFGKIKDRITVQ
jgi:competence protein ComEA